MTDDDNWTTTLKDAEVLPRVLLLDPRAKSAMKIGFCQRQSRTARFVG